MDDTVSTEGLSLYKKILAVFLLIILLAAVAFLVYIIAAPENGDVTTEFYLLGQDGKSENYPAYAFMDNGELVTVKYDDKTDYDPDRIYLIVGIINRENRENEYSLKVLIDNIQSEIYYDDSSSLEIESIKLPGEGKWEKKIGLLPEHSGINEKIEFILYKNGALCFEEPLYLWINVFERH